MPSALMSNGFEFSFVKDEKRRFRPGVAIASAAILCFGAISAVADVKYSVTTMNVSNEAGPKPATLGSVCIARKTSWASLSVTTPSRVTIPLGGNATVLTASAGVDCNTKNDASA